MQTGSRYAVTNAVPQLNRADVQRFQGPASARVINAVQEASSRTGVDFSYLMEKAAAESGFRTDVKATTSSATGLFQFIDSTWLDMVKDHGAKHGLGDLAQAIERRPDGGTTVRDPILRREILDLRKDPRLSALLAGELANENRTVLEGELGRPVGRTELYLAHFLGAKGAAKFLSAMDKDPTQAAAPLLPEAARANRGVFHEGGRARTLGQIFDRFAAKFGEDGAHADQGTFGRRIAGGDADRPSPLGEARSGAKAQEPLSTFTVMLLNQLAPPDEDGKKDPSRRNQDENGEDLTPRLGAGVMGV